MLGRKVKQVSSGCWAPQRLSPVSDPVFGIFAASYIKRYLAVSLLKQQVNFPNNITELNTCALTTLKTIDNILMTSSNQVKFDSIITLTVSLDMRAGNTCMTRL